MLSVVWIELQPPAQWDAAASMMLMLVFVGFFIADHAFRALSADLGYIKAQPLGYSLPLALLFGGIGLMIAAGYLFVKWASL